MSRILRLLFIFFNYDESELIIGNKEVIESILFSLRDGYVNKAPYLYGKIKKKQTEPRTICNLN